MKLLRRRVARTDRYSPRERPVTRTVRLPFVSTIEYWLFSTHCGYPAAGISSTVYSAFSVLPGSLRHSRGSAPVPFHFRLTGACSVPLGSGTFVQRT